MTRWHLFCLMTTVFAGCGASPEPAKMVHAAEPAKVEHKTVGEADLMTITLTPQAEQRLGVATLAVAVKPVGKRYTVAGEVMLPAGQSVIVGAPVAGHVVMTAPAPAPGKQIVKGQVVLRISPFLPVERDLQTYARAEVAAAETRLASAKLRAQRAAKMLDDGVGSARAKEDADEAVMLAETAV